MAGKFVMAKTNNGYLVVNLKAGNGEVVLTSEFYKAKAPALTGIESARQNAQNEAQFERRTSKAEEPYFVLKAGNGEVLGRSEMYSSAAAMENGIASVRKNAPDAALVDDTGY